VLGAERFVREIEVTANLQHPHILPLFDSGEADSFLFYVMPYIEGESLRDKLEREKQLPVEEAVQIAKEAASALDYAHRHELIHRDIKPGNILLHDGQAVVADFGIALAVSAAGGDRITETGMSLGTPQYMSPEQTTGDRQLDARTDVYSLAAVLYEMLAGDPPHTGSTVQAIITKVVTERPRPVRQLRDTVPVHVERALGKALAKLPADRYPSAREFAGALVSARMRDTTLAAEEGTRVPGARQWIPLVGWPTVATAVVALALGFGLGRITERDVSRTRPVTRFVVDLPPGQGIAPDDLPAIAISSDGKRLVYVGQGERGTQLYLRNMDGLGVVPIAGTEGALGPFFSRDGEWLGFFAGGKLKKVALSGGAPVTLAEAALPRGAAWVPDNTILFTAAPGTGLWRVSASGGMPEVVSNLDLEIGERTHRFPDILPGNREALATIRTGSQSSFDLATIAVLSLETTVKRVLIRGGSQARFVLARYLVFARGGTLHAVAFDPSGLQLVGEPVAVVDSVMTDPSTGAAHYSVSDNGTMIYVAGGDWVARREMRLVSLDGAVRPLSEDRRPFRTPRFSPDGRRLAVVIEAANDDIWIYDLSGGTTRRFTFESGSNIAPVWSPDGESIAFSSNRAGRYNLFLKRADGSGSVQRLTTSEHIQFASSWHPDQSHLVFTQNKRETGSDIWILSAEEGGELEAFLETPFNEYGAVFSPDGSWLAYVSDESGRPEVYVQRYPGGGGKRQISTDGGVHPLWAPDGRQLYYRHGRDIMSVAVATDPRFRSGRPLRMLEAPFNEVTVSALPNYDVARTGRAFVVLDTQESRPPRKINVILNWFEELDQHVGLNRN
jgi:Tol biopolymer transport system component